MSQLVQFMRIHVHDAWFDVDTTRDRVPPSAHQTQRRKTLSRQRLFYLLYECGLVYIIDFTRVGADEFVV